MKKNVWIFNHYATSMYFDKGGRHYWFAKYLKQAGYDPVVFCATTRHNLDEKVDTHGKLCILKKESITHVPYVFVDVPQYRGNGKERIKNMAAFYFNLFKVTEMYAQKYGHPDIILASSVHPLTLVAGIQISKKLGIKCICEVRDLWPETLVVYGKLQKNSLLTKILYQGERWIYKKADAMIFTIPGGRDYIRDMKWNRENGGPIDLRKVYHINNGIDLPVSLKQREECPFVNEQFDSITGEKIIYTGSIREVNDVGRILDAAKLLTDLDVTFCIFGDGEHRERLEKRLQDEKIDNVIFFGKVDKKYIPYIVSRALLLLLYSQNIVEIAKYGTSQNKLFDYLMSGRPILSNLPNKYSIINEYHCGVEKSMPTAEIFADELRDMIRDRDRLEEYGNNGNKVIKEYSFEKHTQKLIEIIENL